MSDGRLLGRRRVGQHGIGLRHHEGNLQGHEMKETPGSRTGAPR